MIKTGEEALLDRRTLMSLVLSGLPKRAEYVKYPDHPLLFQGPDVLAIGPQQQLTAIFIASSRRRHTSPSELSRYLLSKLAYPEETLFVLAVEEETVVGDSYFVLFNEIVRLRADRTPRVPLTKRSRKRVDETLDGIRSSHHERFAVTWSSTLSGERLGDRIPYSPSSTEFTVSRNPRKREQLKLQPLEPVRSLELTGRPTSLGVLVPSGATRPRRRSRSLRTVLQEASTVAARADYALDEDPVILPDLSELLSRGDIHLQIHENQDVRRATTRGFDVYKPLRAAAFAGLESIVEDTI